MRRREAEPDSTAPATAAKAARASSTASAVTTRRTVVTVSSTRRSTSRRTIVDARDGAQASDERLDLALGGRGRQARLDHGAELTFGHAATKILRIRESVQSCHARRGLVGVDEHVGRGDGGYGAGHPRVPASRSAADASRAMYTESSAASVIRVVTVRSAADATMTAPVTNMADASRAVDRSATRQRRRREVEAAAVADEPDRGASSGDGAHAGLHCR